mmetsp:Transcript_791/g.1934  ORF Transcript_791/g.1934 Transcript_791/m.1934 type:complete len:203 (+) Transcript_791:1628-2236(+)
MPQTAKSGNQRAMKEEKEPSRFCTGSIISAKGCLLLDSPSSSSSSRNECKDDADDADDGFGDLLHCIPLNSQSFLLFFGIGNNPRRFGPLHFPGILNEAGFLVLTFNGVTNASATKLPLPGKLGVHFVETEITEAMTRTKAVPFLHLFTSLLVSLIVDSLFGHKKQDVGIFHFAGCQNYGEVAQVSDLSNSLSNAKKESNES